MRSLFVAIACCAAAVAVSPAAEQIVTLGDSLTYAYEAEFGFEVNTLFGGTRGDGFGPEVRNWIEILNDPAYRNESFDLGARDMMHLNFFFIYQYDVLFRHQFNWALPGLRIEELRAFLAGETTFDDLVAAQPELNLFLGFSDLDTESDFRLVDLESQIQSEAERLVLFIGGNDARDVYGPIYSGSGAGAFVGDFVADAAEILDRVQTLNPDLPIVLVNVPHVGITPDIRSSYPYDPIATGRVTEVMRDLNQQLAGLARSRGIGYADVFTPTLPLLDPTRDHCVHGIAFLNEGSVSGDLDYVWLNGEFSANFHPNTNAQASIANAVIDAFNERYDTGIAPLSATDILGGSLGKTAQEIDMPFESWMACHGLDGLPGADDSDGDGVSAAVEFATGLNPSLRDGGKIRSRLAGSAGSLFLELIYPIRLPSSSHVVLSATATTDPALPFVPLVPAPTVAADGFAHALLPASGGRGFLRLEATVSP
ncbi:MAG: SGNH/GDSL hydrolase family protein [Verrucomicrobiae bacterium]|nr:SGNH/GDSL hydrolase family protein [Verrucomicrobiae bacterium]